VKTNAVNQKVILYQILSLTMQGCLFLVNPEVKIITLTYNVLQWADKMSHYGLENTINKLLHLITCKLH
jgi:hypothetical protein